MKHKYGEKILLSCTQYHNTKNKNNYHHNNLHQYGKINSNILIEALIDLFLLASANNILIVLNNSGYSRLARYLCNHKIVLNKMLDLGNAIDSPQIT